MTELIVIPFSHFCEKAHWGLEVYRRHR